MSGATANQYTTAPLRYGATGVTPRRRRADPIKHEQPVALGGGALFDDNLGTGYVPGLALWVRSRLMPRAITVMPMQTGRPLPMYFCVVDDFGALQPVAFA